VRRVGYTETFDIVLTNYPAYNVGAQICIPPAGGTPPCSGILDTKYSGDCIAD
jgi:hypothetical protein